MRFFIVFLAVLLIPINGYSSVGRVVKGKGKVEIVKNGTFKGIPFVKLNGEIDVGDTVRTKRKSEADVEFIDKTTVHLFERSRLIVEKYLKNEETRVKNPYGKVLYKVVRRVKGKFIVETPVVLIGVKGTTFLVDVNFERTIVKVIEGEIEIENRFQPEQKIRLKKNQEIKISNVEEIFTPDSKETEKPIVYEDREEEVIKEITENEEPSKENNFNVNIDIPQVSIEGL